MKISPSARATFGEAVSALVSHDFFGKLGRHQAALLNGLSKKMQMLRFIQEERKNRAVTLEKTPAEPDSD
jgi:hypothetical protein